MRTVRSTIALLLAFLLAAALCGCAASPSGGQLASTPGSGPAKPVDAADFMCFGADINGKNEDDAGTHYGALSGHRCSTQCPWLV